MTETFRERLERITSEIELGMNCTVKIGEDPGELYDEDGCADTRNYLQVECWRMDVITREMGFGYGGKAYPSTFATDSEIIQIVFGLYKGYWEHEARETFVWRGRRPFGPHISTEALWEVARRVDVRSQKHEEDR
jgi:hypothetical protein